jgi:hypothetical protein
MCPGDTIYQVWIPPDVGKTGAQFCDSYPCCVAVSDHCYLPVAFVRDWQSGLATNDFVTQYKPTNFYHLNLLY